MVPETLQSEQRLKDDIEQLRSQQEQTLGILNARINAMMERRIQARVERLDGLLETRSKPKNGGAYTKEPSREPRLKFNEHSNRGRTYGSVRGRGNPSRNATGCHRPRNPTNIRVALLAAGNSGTNDPLWTHIRVEELIS